MDFPGAVLPSPLFFIFPLLEIISVSWVVNIPRGFVSHGRQTLLSAKLWVFRANIFSLFLVGHVPSDNQIRNLLDPVSPQQMAGEYEWIYGALKDGGQIEAMRDVGGTILIALDGVTFFESTEIHCKGCLSREDRNGRLHYYHSAITPVIVKPGYPHVVALI